MLSSEWLLRLLTLLELKRTLRIASLKMLMDAHLAKARRRHNAEQVEDGFVLLRCFGVSRMDLHLLQEGLQLPSWAIKPSKAEIFADAGYGPAAWEQWSMSLGDSCFSQELLLLPHERSSEMLLQVGLQLVP